MRSSGAFQVMGDVRSIVLDKTGTLTHGAPAVAAVAAASGTDEDAVLGRAASAESASEHPLARAIEDVAETGGLDVASPWLAPLSAPFAAQADVDHGNEAAPYRVATTTMPPRRIPMSLAHHRGPLGTRPYGEFLGHDRLYVESSPKRLRVQVATATIVDTLHARLLHQPGMPASWWFPRTDVREDLLEDGGDGGHHPLLGRTRLLDLHTGGRRVPGFAHHHPDVAALRGLLHLDCHKADRVYEEDELVAAEAIDPFHRVDVRDASRHVRVSLGGVSLAESQAPRMVFETTARPRFYFTPEELRTDLLIPSSRQAVCQYKGDGEYFHVQLGDQLISDLVWRYTLPRDDGRRITGRYSVHHERCHTEIDGSTSS